ncbi:NADPH oxidase 5-like [Strongylocentrotus purpuratus]|uniref:Ferric reductase NAD binding domain-containing protein n=1 Tax=Strongylocentrotus purpuratus TaxID=7668 RepID=A0A7M7PPD4_STRPU|nr:NADPH oxidase 5-like [Strongylocentrotus purpuratus]
MLSIVIESHVDFVWINRDQHSFEWFISLISAIELEQAEIPAADRFLDIHLYMTSALSPSDMKAIGLHVALDLIHKKKKRDTITGLKTRTQAGRPDWDEVFQNLKQQHKGKITVFFCGSPALGKVLSTKCLQYQMEFRKENF